MNLIQFNSGHVLPEADVRLVAPICRLTTERLLDINIGEEAEGEAYINIKDNIIVLTDWVADYVGVDDTIIQMVVGQNRVEAGSGSSQPLKDFLNDPVNMKTYNLDETAMKYFNSNLDKCMKLHELIKDGTSLMIPDSSDQVDMLLDRQSSITPAQLQVELVKKISRLQQVLGAGHTDRRGDWVEGFNVTGEVKANKTKYDGLLEIKEALGKIGVTISPEVWAEMMDPPFSVVVK